MPHVLIAGATMQGKTSLAVELARGAVRSGFEPIVLDPLLDPRWPTAHVYDDPERFLAVVEASRRCALFVDESGEMVGRYSDTMNRLATRYRHLGHRSHFSVQHAPDLALTVREQCAHLFAFRMGPRGARRLAEDWICPQLEEELPRLQPLTCLYVRRSGEFSIVRVKPA